MPSGNEFNKFSENRFMKIISPFMRTQIHRVFTHSKNVVIAAFAIFILSGISVRAQQDSWKATSPDDFSDATAWSSGAVPGSANQAVIDNSGTCLYTTDDTNSLDQFWMGPPSSSTSGGGNNTFTMSGGSLTMNDVGGNNFSIGGNSSATLYTKATGTNTFTMTGGALTVICGSGNNLIGMATNTLGTVNFDGGNVDFGVGPATVTGTETNGGLFIGGLGMGILNIDGANVSIDTTNNSYGTTKQKQGALVIGYGFQSVPGVGSGILNMMSGTLNVTNSVIHIGCQCATNILNISGGTINCQSIAFGSGDGSSPTVPVQFIMSGGTINLLGTGGFAQDGADYKRTSFFSGGTLVSFKSCGFSVAMTNGFVLTNSPGPGYLTLAPNAGTVITCPSYAAASNNFTGPGGLICAGPGTVKIGGQQNFTGGLTLSGGTLDVNVAQIQNLGLNNTGGNLQIDTVSNALLDSPITIPSGNTITFDGTAAIPFTNVVTGAGSLVVNGSGSVITNSGNFNYTGNTTITKGDLALVDPATIASPYITIGSAGTLDVSALASPFMMSPGQVLSNSASTATISGNFISSSGALSLNFASSKPSFNITNGTFTLSSGTALSVNNTGAAFGAGTYTLIGDGPNGTVAGTVPSSYTMSGNGFLPNTQSSLIISGSNTLDLLVTSTANPNPTNIVFSVSNNQLTLSWPTDHVGWTLQVQTNSLTTGLSTNWVIVAGSAATNQETMSIDPANGSVFYRLMFVP